MSAVGPTSQTDTAQLALPSPGPGSVHGRASHHPVCELLRRQMYKHVQLLPPTSTNPVFPGLSLFAFSFAFVPQLPS